MGIALSPPCITPPSHGRWISREHDLDRVRAIGAHGEIPGIGSRGVHTEATYRRILDDARA